MMKCRMITGLQQNDCRLVHYLNNKSLNFRADNKTLLQSVKQSIYILLFLFFSGCGQRNSGDSMLLSDTTFLNNDTIKNVSKAALLTLKESFKVDDLPENK